jgi:hypothetical protein
MNKEEMMLKEGRRIKTTAGLDSEITIILTLIRRQSEMKRSFRTFAQQQQQNTERQNQFEA